MESLRTSVHLISSQVPGLLVNEGQILSLSDRVTVDLHELVRRAKETGTPGAALSDEACLEWLNCGDLLPGWYDDWVFQEQQRLRKVRLRAFLMLAHRWLEEGEIHRAVEAAESALELEPLHESAVALLISAELKAGNRARALRTFEAFRTNLQIELGIKPTEHLANLAADIHANES
ncbi:bacterial transcriptional activator domain-containing protein [Arthrobacter sp. RT-1]|uniref:AfsR/SARP family transcriptional regulator n=1 Tax=Arthrobacter sp. RT-1 TaxID=2292263 RepID=UPI0015F16A1B|nr:bacterial transcriptional activator domain-containing protein [Arthrobacter sp. RT-1]